MSTKPASEERLFIVPAIALTDHGAASKCMARLLSIMLAPEDKDKQENFFTDFTRAIVKKAEESGLLNDDDFWREYGKEIRKMGEGGKFGAFDVDPFSGRKGYSGSPALKGNLCGQVLYHLIENDAINTLEDAYKTVIKHFASNNTERIYRDEIQSPPTVPYLRSVWKDFFSVAHLWLAEIAGSRRKKMPMMQAIFDGVFTTEDLVHFLSVATRYRKKLVSFPLQTAHGKTLIPYPEDIWRVVKIKTKA